MKKAVASLLFSALFLFWGTEGFSMEEPGEGDEGRSRRVRFADQISQVIGGGDGGVAAAASGSASDHEGAAVAGGGSDEEWEEVAAGGAERIRTSLKERIAWMLGGGAPGAAAAKPSGAAPVSGKKREGFRQSVSRLLWATPPSQSTPPSADPLPGEESSAEEEDLDLKGWKHARKAAKQFPGAAPVGTAQKKKPFSRHIPRAVGSRAVAVVELKDENLDPSTCQYLAGKLSTQDKLRELILINCSVGACGMPFLASPLVNLRELTVLILDDNHTGPKWLRDNPFPPFLQELSVAGNDLGGRVFRRCCSSVGASSYIKCER